MARTAVGGTDVGEVVWLGRFVGDGKVRAGGGRLVVVSDNEAYKPIPWPRDAQVLGQVMWTGRTL